MKKGLVFIGIGTGAAVLLLVLVGMAYFYILTPPPYGCVQTDKAGLQDCYYGHLQRAMDEDNAERKVEAFFDLGKHYEHYGQKDFAKHFYQMAKLVCEQEQDDFNASHLCSSLDRGQSI